MSRRRLGHAWTTIPERTTADALKPLRRDADRRRQRYSFPSRDQSSQDRNTFRFGTLPPSERFRRVTTLVSRIGFVEPMMPALVDEAPEGSNWIHELKYDGYRTQLAIDGEERRAYTRRGHDWSELYRPLIEAARALNCDSALIEGEVIVQDRKGLSDFHTLGSKLNQLVVFGLG